MRSEAIINDVTQWARVGGRELQFLATDAEVLEWLTQGLPSQYAPYHLVGSDLVEDGPVYVEHPFRCEVSALLECMHAVSPNRYIFRLWSEVLTPGLRLRRGEPIGAMCSLNGLVGLQHGFLHHGRRDISRISITDKVRHLETGAVLEHEGYFDIYKTLRREVKKSLHYANVWCFDDGSEREDDRHGCWTEGAVEEYEAGVPFVSRPGRRLEGKAASRLH
jgi:hypothetical protein